MCVTVTLVIFSFSHKADNLCMIKIFYKFSVNYNKLRQKKSQNSFPGQCVKTSESCCVEGLLFASCLSHIDLTKVSKFAALPAWGASCGLIFFNPEFLPNSLHLSQEMKCDFHFFSCSAWMLSLHLCRDSVPGVFRVSQAAFWSADWLEGARFVTSPTPVCRHFNYHRDSRTFSSGVLTRKQSISLHYCTFGNSNPLSLIQCWFKHFDKLEASLSQLKYHGYTSSKRGL